MGGWESASRWLGYFREGQRKGAGEGTREAERGWNLGEELAAAGGGGLGQGRGALEPKGTPRTRVVYAENVGAH